jgi:SOS response regulatory protein OraA/RecX
MVLSLMPIPGSPKRVQLCVDGEPVKKISCSIVPLTDINSLPEERLLERLHELELRGGIRYALAHLSRQSTHSKALERALRRHCLEPSVIAEIITYCTRQGWLDDAAWLERHVEAWQAKGKSPQAIAAYLRSKGVSSDLRLDEQAALRAIIDRRFPQLLSPDLAYPDRARIFRSLQRRGFSLSAVQRFLREGQT